MIVLNSKGGECRYINLIIMGKNIIIYVHNIPSHPIIIFRKTTYYINFSQILQRNFKENVLGIYREKNTKHKVCTVHRQISQRCKACGG